MLLDPYRDCSDYREILRILQKSSSLQDNLLWQSLPSGKKIINPQHVEIDFISRGVSVFYDAQKYSFDCDLPLYVKLEYRNTVFKVSEFRVGQHNLQFSFPETLKTLELRSEPRVVFANDDRLISLRPTLSAQTNDAGSELRVRLVDLSRSGAGMLISENNRSFLKNNRFLWLTHLNQHSLPDPVLAEVVYMTSEVDRKFSQRKQKQLKAGLKFSSAIPQEILSEFLS